jgi:hypothetical protein
MGLLDYIRANTPRATTPRVKPGKVFNEGLLNPNAYNKPAADRFKDSLFGGLGIVPGVGDVASAAESADLFNRGENFAGSMAALGALPFVPAMGGVIRYHGGNDIFDVFNVKSKSVNDMGLLGDVPTERHGAFVTNKPNFAAEYGNVTKWDVKPKNTAKINDSLRDEFLETLDPFGAERDLWLRAKYGSKQDWLLFEDDLGQRFTDFLKSKGFDSAMFNESIPTKTGKEVSGQTTVILDPSIAKKLK